MNKYAVYKIGCFKETARTKKWTPEEKQRMQDLEEKSVFEHCGLSYRSAQRTHIATCRTKGEAEDIVSKMKELQAQAQQLLRVLRRTRAHLEGSEFSVPAPILHDIDSVLVQWVDPNSDGRLFDPLHPLPANFMSRHQKQEPDPPNPPDPSPSK